MAELGLKVKIIPDMSILDRELKKGTKLGLGGGTKPKGKEESTTVEGFDKLLTEVGIVGGLIAVLGDALSPILAVLKQLSALILIILFPILKPGLEAMAKMMPTLVKVAQELGKLLKAGFDGVVWIITKVVEGIIGVGKFFIDLGKKIGDFYIKFGETIANIIKKIFSGAADFGQWLYDKVIVPVADFITGIITSIADKIIAGFEFLANVGSWIWNNILYPAFNFLSDVGSRIWNILKTAFEFLSDVGKWIWDILKSAFNLLVDSIKGLISKISRLFGDGKSSKSKSGKSSKSKSSKYESTLVDSVEDAIISPGGNIITTNPRDYLIATTNPAGLMGGGNSSMTININNPVVRDNTDIKKIANEVQKVLQKGIARQSSR